MPLCSTTRFMCLDNIVVLVTVMGNRIHPPYFAKQRYELAVSEGSQYNHTIGYVKATNPDKGNMHALSLL